MPSELNLTFVNPGKISKDNKGAFFDIDFEPIT